MSTAELPFNVRLRPESAGLSMSPEEFDAATDYDDSVNFELIHGVLVVTPMASRSERSPNDLLGYWLQAYRYQHPAGSCLVETFFEDYLRTQNNRRRADRVIWIARAGSKPDPQIDVPTIAVEFVSVGKAAWQRDYVEKRDEYLEAGVVEYWVADRFRRVLTVYTKPGDKMSEQIVHENEIYRTALLPGFELPLKELLAAADRYRDAVDE
jgi:Uma2 family endonuclease